MTRLALAMLAASLASAATAQEAGNSRPARCLLKIGAQTHIDGACRFTPLAKDGSFQIMSEDGLIFAQVSVDRPGQGRGYWNGAPGNGHAHDPLGPLTRSEACWASDSARICAW